MQNHGTAGLAELDRECAEGREAPRVSLDDIQANISYVGYFTAGGAIEALGQSDEELIEHGRLEPEQFERSLAMLTICLIVLGNGYTIIGKSAPASPANFDPQLGK